MLLGTARWSARGSLAGVMCVAIVLFFGIVTPGILAKFFLMPRLPISDYFAFYSFSRFIHDYPAALIYDPHLLEQLQTRLHGFGCPYLYGPAMLLLVWPLSYLPFVSGWLCWIGLGLLAYLTAIGMACRNRVAMVAAVVAPSTLWTTMCGQTTLFGAALFFGGFRLLPRHPILAGTLFGVLTYKPQLAVLVPVALLGSSQWRCLLSMCLSAAALLLASSLAFGAGIWEVWMHHLPALGTTIAQNMNVFCPLMATVTSNLLVFGVPPADAHAIQALVTLASCAVVCRCVQSGVTMLGAAAVAVATFLATPYAFGYDMPLLTGAVLIVTSDCHRHSGSFASWEIIALASGFLLPCCIVFSKPFCLSSLVAIVLLWLIGRRIAASDPRPPDLSVITPPVVT